MTVRYKRTLSDRQSNGHRTTIERKANIDRTESERRPGTCPKYGGVEGHDAENLPAGDHEPMAFKW